jgi:release factor glutamine methyltransferase
MQDLMQAVSSIRALLAEAEAALGGGPHAEKARRDAEALTLLALQHEVPGASRAWLIAHEDEAAGVPTIEALGSFVERRLTGEPIQYIGGEAEFYGLLFRVNRDVLIPRPETEHLVERVIALAHGVVRPRIVDVGTGSGAIAIALACKLPEARIVATDVSTRALAVAHENAERNGVARRARFLEGDLLAPVAGEPFDFVVSNPPYVPERDRESLSVEVRDFEPPQALFAADDGLAIYRRLIPQASRVLVPGGYIALEIGFGQREAVRALLAESGFAEMEFTYDLQGIPRVATAPRV